MIFPGRFFDTGGAGEPAAQAYVTRVPLRTTTGTQSITIDGLTDTPVAAMFVISRAVTDGVKRDFGAGSVGFATATQQAVVGFRCPVGRGGSQSNVVFVEEEQGAGDSYIAVAALDSFYAGGCDIDVTTAPGEAFLLTVTFFCDDKVADAHVEAIQLTAGGTKTVTPGFETHALLMASNNQPLDGTDKTSASTLGLGFGTYDGTSTYTQCGMSFNGGAPGGTTATNCHVVDGKIKGGGGSAGALVAELEFQNVTSTAFDIDNDVGSSGPWVIVLALELNDPTGAHAEVLDMPTATGSQTVTSSASFLPSQAILALSTMRSTNTVATDGEGAGFGVSTIDEGAQFSTAWHMRDGQTGTVDHGSLADDQAINLLNHAGGITELDAEFVSFGTGEIDLIVNAVNGAAPRKISALFLA